MVCILPIDSNSKGRLVPAFLQYANLAEDIIKAWILYRLNTFNEIYEYDISSTTKSFVLTNTFKSNKESYCSSWHNYGLAIKFSVRLILKDGSASIVEYSDGLYEDVSSFIYDNYRYIIKGMPESSGELIWGGMLDPIKSIWYFEWHPGYEVNEIQKYRTDYLNKVFPSTQQYNVIKIVDGYVDQQRANYVEGSSLSGYTDQDNLTLSEFYSVYKLRKELNGIDNVKVTDLEEYIKNNPYSTYYEYVMAYMSGDIPRYIMLKRYMQVLDVYSIIKDESIKMPDPGSDILGKIITSSAIVDDVGFIPEGLKDLYDYEGDNSNTVTATFNPRIDGDSIIAIDDNGIPVKYMGTINMTRDTCQADPNKCIGDFGPSGRLQLMQYAKKQDQIYSNREDRISRYFISNRNTDGSVDGIEGSILIPDGAEVIGGVPVVRTGEEEMITPPGAPNILVKRGVVEVHIPTIIKKNKSDNSILYK